MKETRSILRTWRRSLTLITAMLVTTIVMSVPTTASAMLTSCYYTTCPPAPSKVAIRASDDTWYKGYATIDPSPDCTFNTTTPRCMIAVMASVPAYRWNSASGWALLQRATGTRVYVYPYGSGWSWTWTSSTGWLAVRSSAIIITYPGQIAPICPGCG